MGYTWLKWVTPNQLTLGRILAAPLLMVLISLDSALANWLAILLFLLASLTDYVDGNLARHRGEVTPLGRMLDPIADKIVISASLVMLVAQGHADSVPTILIIMREFAVSGMREVAAQEGVPIPSLMSAKWKTTLQMVATGLLLLHHDPFGLPLKAIGRVLLWAAMAVTVWTGYQYFNVFFHPQRGSLATRPQPPPPADAPQKPPAPPDATP